MKVLRLFAFLPIFILASTRDNKYPLLQSMNTPPEQVHLQEGKGIVRTLNINPSITLEYFEKEASASFSSINLRINLIGTQQASPHFSVSARIKNEGAEPAELAIISQNQTRESFNAQFPLRKGNYSINLSVDRSVRVSIVLTKQYLNHLKLNGNPVATKAGVSEFYSEKAEIIQVYQCQGDIRVIASSNYDELFAQGVNSNATTLEETNFAAHFLIDTKRGSGEYFIRVEGKDHKADISYLIKHSSYNPGNVVSSAITSFPSQKLTYMINKRDELTVRMGPVTIAPHPSVNPELIMIVYEVAIGTDKERLQRFINCKVGSFHQFRAQHFDEDGYAIANIYEIHSLIGDSEIFYITAECKVYIDPNNDIEYQDYPLQLRFPYQIISLNQTELRRAGLVFPTILVLLSAALLYFVLRWYQSKKRHCELSEVNQTDPYQNNYQQPNES